MHFAAPLLLLTRWMRRPARRAARPQEPADMGTAFGMEQWLDEADSLPAPLADTSAQRLGRRRWLPRWLHRSLVH